MANPRTPRLQPGARAGAVGVVVGAVALALAGLAGMEPTQRVARHPVPRAAMAARLSVGQPVGVVPLGQKTPVGAGPVIPSAPAAGAALATRQGAPRVRAVVVAESAAAQLVVEVVVDLPPQG